MSDKTTIIAYKGFDADMKCRDFQYEVGKSYDHDGKIELCNSGFHACEHSLSVLRFYSPTTSRYALVEASGEIARSDDGDTKICSARISIKAELQLPDLIDAAVKWVFARAKWADGPVATKDNEGATASGESGAATASGRYGAATASGRSGAATASGESGAATASGWSGAATASGRSGAATASGESGAATASGRSGAATASGESGAATASGWSGAATASHSTAVALASRYGRVSGVAGAALFLAERDDEGSIIHAWAGIAGQDGIEPDTWYSLKGGKPVEVTS